MIFGKIEFGKGGEVIDRGREGGEFLFRKVESCKCREVFHLF